MNYIDAFVAAVPLDQREAYRRHAAETAQVFKEHGAISIVECWGDDVPEGKLTSFPLAVKRQPDEVVTFGWIAWPSRQARDVGMQRAMQDPRMQPDRMHMPFDGQRMIYGGFEVLLKV